MMEEMNGKAHTAHMIERDPKMTFWLFFSITVCVFGNSFLYGYNIGVVNSPGPLLKAFYFQIYLARDGIETVYIPESKSLHYVELPESKRAAISTTAATTTTKTLSVVVSNSSQGPNYAAGSNASTTLAPTTTAHPMLAKSKKEIEEDNFIELMWSITVALFVFFGMVGAFTSGRVADYFGRKKGMIIITVLMFVAAIFGAISSVAKSPECLMVSRVFVGLHNGISVSLASLYLAEISPKKIRGAVGTCHQLFITIGILWSMILGLPDLSGTWGAWPVLFGFNALPALVCLLLFPLCPESPRYMLIKKNDEDGAKKGLVKLRGYSDVEDELEEMRVEARKASTVESFSLKKLLTTPELKLPIIIAVVVQIAQQWSGINAAMSYSSFIFKQAEVPEDTIPYVIVGQGAINVLATIVCVPLMEKLGRRPLLIFPMCGMVLSFLVLTISLNLLQSGNFDDQKFALAMVSITVMMTYVIGFAVGLGPIPFIVVSEIFRQEPRAAAMSFSLAFNWICNFILMLTFRFIQKGIGAYTYLIFIVILVASIIFIVIFVPETKNKTFDEVAQSIAFGRAKKGSAFGQDAEEMQPMGESQKV
ncbi:solute carrier family 2, facilitated glucose transporter member 5-like isoform X2 [Mercenaria mercenaria]|uniref:solute carrier family 2, facilitated glucose transporter member 5-like isoform X2 n=1 Tax=Mercenaria mercenaria TaxID=6596 RepID=UPI00234EAEB1|nr:solute carrier family 2, facilitated glucose transporter member 5-like isoform X2 [Mercenaria mercenaria]